MEHPAVDHGSITVCLKCTNFTLRPICITGDKKCQMPNDVYNNDFLVRVCIMRSGEIQL